MAVVRDQPYGNQHFTVDLGAGGPAATFSEVILPESSVDVIEYRSGADKTNEVRKIPGLVRCGDVTLKRGVIGSLDLYQWFNDVRNGNVNARRNVVIALESEDRTQVVLTWRLFRAFPVKHSFSNLNAKGEDVLIEELVLACERVEME